MHAPALALLVQLSLAGVPPSTTPGAEPPAEVDVATLPAEQQGAYELLQHKCGRCHALPSLGAPRPKAWWRRHTTRATVAVSDAQLARIIGFLEFWFSPARQASR